VVITRGDIGYDWSEDVEGRAVADLLGYFHIVLDLIEGDVSRAFDHDLTAVLLGSFGKVADCSQFSDLCLVGGVGDASWSEAVTKGEADIVFGHNRAQIIKHFIEGVLLVVVWWYDPPIPHVLESTPGKAYIYAASFLAGFLGGSMLWAMFRIATLMLWLGKKVEIRPSVFDSSSSPLRAVSAVLWKVSFTAIAIYVSIILWLILCANSRGVLTMTVAITFGIIFMLYFIIPQWNIHKTLLKLKQNRLRKLVKQVDSTFDKVTQNPTTENIQQLRSLFDVQRVINGKSPWSFGLTELLVLLGSVIVPLLILIIDWLIRNIKK